jgi:hypothetical protein
LYNSLFMARPLFSKSIDELIQLFEEWRGSAANLQVLAEELSNRTRPKGVALRKRVEMALQELRSAPPATSLSPDELPQTDARTTPQPEQPKTAKPERESNRPFEGDYVPPDQFTLVQPLGVKGRPTAFKPILENDVRLAITPSDSSAKIFRVALFELIREMRRRRIGNQQFTLEDGERLNTDSGGFSYQFEFTEEANLFEGAKVDMIIGGRVVSGHLTALLRGRIVITLQDDFGPVIQICLLRIDATALLQALHDRLEKIERKEVPSFRSEFAESALRNSGKSQSAIPIVRWPWKREPNDRQRDFVGLALANEVSWLWGPPGTGKTDTLSALTRLLYESGKRVLICSNTNQAVDQLLLQLCRKMHDAGETALTEGRVLRLGRIEHDQLKEDFEEFITVESILARKSEGLIQRKSELESELERIGREVAFAEEMLGRFGHLEKIQSAEAAARQEFSKLAAKCDDHVTRLGEAKERESNLAQEIHNRSEAGFFRQLMMRSEATIWRDIQAN